jgi:hypothetical protein
VIGDFFGSLLKKARKPGSVIWSVDGDEERIYKIRGETCQQHLGLRLFLFRTSETFRQMQQM